MSDSVNYPNYPQMPIYFKDVIMVNKGRYATLELNINTDGTLYGSFTVENMQALAGCHITGQYKFFDDAGNITARVKLPLIGLNPAWFARVVTRHHDFEGKIRADSLMNVRRVEFAAYENAIPQGPEAAEELKKIFEMLKGL
jgi:hypothetical protein